MKALFLAFFMLMTPPEISPELEQEAREIGRELRCVVCQNQSIEDSDADLAADMRVLVRERLAEGDDKDEIITMMRDRYGDFVLLKPPIQGNTLVLWFGPILVGLGLLAWLLVARRQRSTINFKPLTEEEQAELDRLRKS